MNSIERRCLVFEDLEARRVLSGLLNASHFEYLGAFRLPGGEFGDSRFGFGGTALAFNANNPGDPQDDTLFMVGHDHHQRVAEVSLPAPVDSARVADLPEASVLQPFADVSDGLKNAHLEGNVKIGGLLVDGGKLIWSAFEFYDADNDARFSHGTSSLDLSNPADASGMYRVGGLNPGFTAGYMALVPPEWRDEIGAPILTGQSVGVAAISTRTSAGPALFAFGPTFQDGITPADPLLYYQHPGDGTQELGDGLLSRNPFYNFNSRVGGVVFPEGSRSVVFFGRHGTGEVCYGTPQACNDPVRSGNGFHDVGGNYVYYAWAYDVLDLLKVKSGQVDPWDVEPYAVWEVGFPNPNPDASIVGVAYDPLTNRVFVSQEKADWSNPFNPKPLIHVYQVQPPDSFDPTVPNVSLSLDQSTIPEAGGVATFTTDLSVATNVAVTVELGISGSAAESDFDVSTTRIIVAPGSRSAAMTISAEQDDVDEPNETVTVEILSVFGGIVSGAQRLTTTVVDDDLSPSFSIHSLSSTPSGFRAAFASELDVGQLNLYHTRDANHGEPDLTLTGANSGLISGSLISDLASSSVTFVKTGGPLEPDTYTVTLRSAPDAFQDSIGRLLDGNGDGTGGDDYVANFTVDEPLVGTRTIGMPDFVRGPGQAVDLFEDIVPGIPISISDGDEVRLVQLRIGYDPALLEIHGATPIAGGSVVMENNTPGLVTLVYFDSGTLPSGETNFINVRASVLDTDAAQIYGRAQVLDIHDVMVSNGQGVEFLAVADDAFHLTALWGDVSGNGTVNANDASQVAAVAAQIDNGFRVSLLVDPIMIGDLSGNGRINALDASWLAQVGILGERPALAGVRSLGGRHFQPAAQKTGTPIVGGGADSSSAGPVLDHRTSIQQSIIDKVLTDELRWSADDLPDGAELLDDWTATGWLVEPF